MSKVYVVDDLLDADIKVYRAPIAFISDGAIYLTRNEDEALAKTTTWYEVDDEHRNDPDVTKIMFTKQDWFADMRIAFVDNAYESRWNNRRDWSSYFCG